MGGGGGGGRRRNGQVRVPQVGGGRSGEWPVSVPLFQGHDKQGHLASCAHLETQMALIPRR